MHWPFTAMGNGIQPPLPENVSDARYVRVLAVRRAGIIDLIVNGTFLTMVLNGTRTAVPKTAEPPLAYFRTEGY